MQDDSGVQNVLRYGGHQSLAVNGRFETLCSKKGSAGLHDTKCQNILVGYQNVLWTGCVCCFGDEEGKETAQQWGRTTKWR